ncbi:hypothetical protein E3T25_13990 [Cryobacterium sandaracinum]|uniref:Lipoprotein n=1 Tax=Cryobacterium sandaracinum TaxID=1259247 RepID=A0ABY2J4N2_9MICO|nr:hypothetical protein [Cryobacterium sandaracinum]TFC99902.1 hypothetical protein E3T25_13990 [Cryobacterium sandaracinum]
MADKFTCAKMVAVAAAALSLMGCSAAGGYSDLMREPSAEDAIPSDLPLPALDGFDLDSVRFVRSLDKTRLYLAQGTDLPVCLLAYRGATDFQGACGSDMTTMKSASFEVMIVKDGTLNRDGWTKVGENILVKNH